jgi:hypothetical protein
VGGIDSVATRITDITHEFRVPAGVVRVELHASGPSDAPGHDKRAFEDGFDTADGKRNPAITAVTVSDNLYRGWTSTNTLKMRRALGGLRSGRAGR